MPPVVSIIGRSKSGKTTLVEKLVTGLKQRGYRVATIKHAQEIDFEPGKDSWRHIQAGSEATIIVSPDEAVLIKSITSADTFNDISRLLGEDYDIILTEGFKQADTPKIEVRYGRDNTPLKNIKRLVAVVSDQSVEKDVRYFSSRDTAKLVDLLEEGFIKPQRKRLALYVNGRRLTLKSFPRKIIYNLMTSMVSSLKGVKKVNSLDIFIRKNPL
ncbi:MAG: molybdopterin-guanine dinucleotide biosynthesis protein B [Dehalococcoidia bacterium]|nr:MAG: molybdopterin-guanine dinucleotide biosynthesis protein B [Dehalococcoidia bacterium]